ncbi:hypothetical protein FHETE_3959 [Fusarium heterosporum]|uniref:Uncharacterized protein n=1 Tax=Fusarium heterosporum TaxID=42747 RepID=A0A8H5WTM9_FUSHE|nr:hypothetical protein FHETE_3959 [Fusarium heterosporum]
MTDRGVASNPAPPLLPPQDPTLETRPVPRERLLPIQSFGPGAAPDIHSTVQPIRDLQTRVNSQSYNDKYGAVIQLLQTVERNLHHGPDVSGSGLGEPTWGFYVFVTAYSAEAREKLPSALKIMVEISRRAFSIEAHPDFAAEAYKRFKLDVIQDKEALGDASDDRIRNEFDSLTRALGLWDDAEHCPDGPVRPGRYVVCLVLDEAQILKLASLSFPEDPNNDYDALQDIGVKVVDRLWRRPANGRGSYPGFDICPVNSLAQLYHHTSAGDPGAIMDMYPLYEEFY